MEPVSSERAPKGTPKKQTWGKEELPRRPPTDLDDFSKPPAAQKHCNLQGFSIGH